MGFYVQDDFWLAIEDAPKSAQDALFGALVRLYFTDTDEPPKGAAKGVYIALRDRVRKARGKSHPGVAGRKSGSDSGDSGNQNVNQNANQVEIKTESNTESDGESKPNQTEIKPKKREREREEETEEGQDRGRARFRAPTPEEVAAYAAERGIAVDAGRFCDFYASKGWKVGRSPMTDWQAAARNWARRDEERKEGGHVDLGEFAGCF
ncbi:MAG: hypothetical protein HFJ75_07595 [Eggerthellaceae bacterium]|nr:hypothetical protein [Eggerthellaceae bacterium]